MKDQKFSLATHEFVIDRDEEKCIRCRVCERQCGFDAHHYDEKNDRMLSCDRNCVACQRCVLFCPTGCLKIKKNDVTYKDNSYWGSGHIANINKQAESGGVLLSGMGNDFQYPVYFDHMLINASQVTNPPIDPLREPMETRTYLGAKPNRLEVVKKGDSYQATAKTTVDRDGLKTGKDRPGNDYPLAPPVKLETPLLFSAMSFGSISLPVSMALARAAKECGILWNTGEGGLHHDLKEYSSNAIVQVASGRFGVDLDYLNAGRIIEIKIGQGAKPGIGGHLPGEKVTEGISSTRMIPVGSDAISPAPHHDIYSIEDLRQLIFTLKEATNYEKPVSVKISAVHNVAAIATGAARAGADIIAIDGFRGGTGAAPTMIRNNVGIPIEIALAVVDERLRHEGLRNQVSVIAAGGFRCSADVLKAIALGADAVYIATAALIAIGCRLCQQCYTGKCSWGITTQDPYKTRGVNPDIAAERLQNLIHGWTHEIKEMMGGMGINSLESLRGNRLHLCGVGLNSVELEQLGIKHAGEGM